MMSGLIAIPVRGASDRPKLEYNRDIRPILAENCFACHGPDSAARKADLRLDQRDAAIHAGAIVPGKPDASELVLRIHSSDAAEVMPPKETTKTLSAAERATLARWIAEGAEYQPHWSLIAPRRPPLPAVKDPAWVRNPIDRFVLAKLEEIGLKPAPEASRRTLARRLSLDLTGLPPDPAAVERFVHDASKTAYEDLVDALLARPEWGEHRARYWLDLARYADTNGYHFDNYREAWAYRDWVIRAFNRNLPFDRFTIEQIAGDLLPHATLDQQVASGFNRCNATTNEGGVIPEEYQVLYTRDRTETVSLVWMGLTAGCAVCHDHKFDPISQREFYALSAFFNNTTQPVMDGNVQDTPPTLFVPAANDRKRWESLQAEKSAIRADLEKRARDARPEFTRWLGALEPETLRALAPSNGLQLEALDLLPGERPSVKSYAADFGDFEKDHAFSFGAWIKIPNAGGTGSIFARMDDRNNYRGWDLWLEGARVATHLVHHWSDDAIKVVTSQGIPIGEWVHVMVTYDGSGKAGGVSIYVDGRKRSTETHADSLKGSIRTAVALKLRQRETGSKLENVLVHSLRIYDRVLDARETNIVMGLPGVRLLAAAAEADRTPGELERAYRFWREAFDPVSRALLERRADVDRALEPLVARGTKAHVMHERSEEAMAYVLFRGEYDKRRDPVKPATPAALPTWPRDLPRNRLGLAEWLVRPEHPLTARVVVNRFWQEVFGVGLVSTTGDFGVTGELPSNQNLLDWLAVEFRDSGWNVKRLFKLMVTSATYRQSAVVTPEKRAKDAQNRLLSRGPRFRMDGEMVRDAALEAGGLLVRRMGGPSVRPYQPEGVWEAVAMPESNTHFYVPDHGEKLYRRSVYTFWKRSAPPASFEIFNAPTRETCTVKRERTNTPLQALVTLNDPQFIEAARGLATLALKHKFAREEDRIDWMCTRLIARPLGADERPAVLVSLERLAQWYQSRPEEALKLINVGESRPDAALDPGTLAAWTMLANELMNLDEFLNK